MLMVSVCFLRDVLHNVSSHIAKTTDINIGIN